MCAAIRHIRLPRNKRLQTTPSSFYAENYSSVMAKCDLANKSKNHIEHGQWHARN